MSSMSGLTVRGVVIVVDALVDVLDGGESREVVDSARAPIRSGGAYPSCFQHFSERFLEHAKEVNRCLIGPPSWWRLCLEFVFEFDGHGNFVFTLDLAFMRHTRETLILPFLEFGVYFHTIRSHLVDLFHDVIGTPRVGVMDDGRRRL